MTSGAESSDSGEDDNIVEQISSEIADAGVQNEEEEEKEEEEVDDDYNDDEGNDEEDENKTDKNRNENWEFAGNASDPEDTNFNRVSSFSSMKAGITNAVTSPGGFARNISVKNMAGYFWDGIKKNDGT
jgi:hypothetical protein